MAISKTSLLTTITLLFSTLFLSSCSLSEGEPRVTVCQKVVQKLLDVPEVEWKKSHIETEELSRITVSLMFDVSSKSGGHEYVDTLSAVCVYAYNDIAEYDVVGREYEDSPTDVYLNDKMVDHYTLMKTVNSVMGDAIKGLFE